MMNGKEKLDLACMHKEGPILFDIGAMPTTGMHCSVVEKLRAYYGLEKRPIQVIEPMQFLGKIDDDLKAALGVQTSSVWDMTSIFGFKQNDSFREWRTPWGQEVLVSDEFRVTTDINGDTLIYAGGDCSYPPAGRMATSSFYFDVIDRNPDFDEDNYNINDNFEEFSLISKENLDWFSEKANRYENSTDVISSNFGGTGIGDIALVPGPGLKKPKGLRNITEWYISQSIRQDILHEIFSYQTQTAIENLKEIYKAVGNTIQVVYICGTDFGTQNGPFCSTNSFRELYAPYYRKINQWIHENTGWKTFKHSCGSIFSLIPELIEAGFDILNPVQWTAQGMNRQEIKSTYGDNIILWGGGIDTQKTLPFGSANDVYKEALETLKIFGKNGGYIFNTIHNIQPGVPVENVAALAEAVRKYNGER